MAFTPIPAGNVVVKRYVSSACPGVHPPTPLPPGLNDDSWMQQPATLDVRPPTSPMDICAESPYPGPDYVVTHHLTTNECWNMAIKQHTKATWSVRKVQPQSDHVCSNSRIPDGYVIKQALTDPNCTNPTTGTSQASSYDIKLPERQETICAFSPIPSNYLVSQVVYVPNCVHPNSIPGSGFGNGHAYVITRVQ